MIKEINSLELAKILKRLKEGELLNFSFDYEDEELIGCFAAQKIKWLDNTLILIGGYENESLSCDITLLNDVEINEEIEILTNSFLDRNNTYTVFTEI